jgi:hypothetical protein
MVMTIRVLLGRLTLEGSKQAYSKKPKRFARENLCLLRPDGKWKLAHLAREGKRLETAISL